MQKRFLIFNNAKIAIVFLVLALMLFGCLNVYSASFVLTEASPGLWSPYVLRYLVFGAAGLVLMYYLGWKVDYHRLFNHTTKLFFLFFGLLLAVDLVGRAAKGAQRWLVFGPFSFQPSEFAKLAVIIMASAYLGKLMNRGKRADLLRLDSCAVFIQTLVLALLVLKQPDMGTSAIIVALVLVLYIIAGLPWSQLGILGFLLVVGTVVSVIIAPYRLNRVRIWLDPFSDAQGFGYQAVQSQVAIGSGGLIGLGSGRGLGKFFYLPEAHTDFAFAIFCQEYGYIGALLLILAFVVLGFAIYAIAQRTQDRGGFLLVNGINFLVVGQAIANMMMVCGLLPVIGVPLSFISYGGTSLVTSLMGIGLVISVYHDEVRREEREEPMKPPMPIMHDSYSYRTARRPKDRWKK